MLAGGVEARTRAKEIFFRLIHLMYQMGLISAVVYAQVDTQSAHEGAGHGAYMVHRLCRYEEPVLDLDTTTTTTMNTTDEVVEMEVDDQKEGQEGDETEAAAAPPTASTHTAAASPTAPKYIVSRKLHTFNVTEKVNRDSYWNSMQFMVMFSPLPGDLLRSSLSECFPFKDIPEASSDRAWIDKSLSDSEQVALVAQRISKMTLTRQEITVAGGGAVAAGAAAGVGCGAAGDGAFGVACDAGGGVAATDGGDGGAGAPAAAAGAGAGAGASGGGACDGGAPSSAAKAATDTSSATAATADVLTWEAAVKLAHELNVPFEVVALAISRAQKDGAVDLGGGSLPTNRHLTKRSASAADKKRRRGDSSEEEGDSKGGDDEDDGGDDDDDDDDGGDGDDDDDGGGRLHGLEMGAGEGGVQQLPPRRKKKWQKKKWHEDEDRQLLEWWARWLVTEGPEAIIPWEAGSIPGLPVNVPPKSCKGRIEALRHHRETAAMMQSILVVSLDMQSRWVKVGGDKHQQEQPPAGETHPSSAPPAATAGKEEEEEETPAAKRARIETSSSQKETGAEHTAAAVAPAVEKSGGGRELLWDVSDDMESRAIDRVLEEIDKIVAIAPNRPKKKKKKPAGMSDTATSAAHVSGGGAASQLAGTRDGSNRSSL